MTDDRQMPDPPFDLEKLFAAGHAHEGEAKPAAAPRPAPNADPAPAPGDPVEQNGHHHDDVAERCRRMALQVQQETLKPVYNVMKPCKGELVIPPCKDVQLPDIRPRFYVFWGDSKCDCIESDDTETMFLVVYNPHRNMRLCNVEVNRLRVVNASGANVAMLPDKTPSVQIVPRGPYCFGDLAPCSIAWRQFVIRLRGAPSGPYRILIEGICYQLCLHRMVEECVTFDVCKD
jgi:hypothetical protein